MKFSRKAGGHQVPTAATASTYDRLDRESRSKKASPRIETNVCPAATTSGCTAGGPTSAADQLPGRSHPSIVRTHGVDISADDDRSENPSTWQANKPTPNSNNEIPTIKRTVDRQSECCRDEEPPHQNANHKRV
jgi:hypothetical protein